MLWKRIIKNWNNHLKQRVAEYELYLDAEYKKKPEGSARLERNRMRLIGGFLDWCDSYMEEEYENQINRNG